MFIGEIITDIALVYDTPMENQCGSCRKCIVACPTSALLDQGHFDARKCISYLTIEFRGDFDESIPKNFEKHIYGCDICQDVCPWNKYPYSPLDEGFSPNKRILEMSSEDWLDLSENEFTQLTKGSCISRTGLERMKRNIGHILKETDQPFN